MSKNLKHPEGEIPGAITGTKVVKIHFTSVLF